VVSPRRRRDRIAGLMAAIGPSRRSAIDRHWPLQRVTGPSGRQPPRGVVQNSGASQTCRLERVVGCGIIGARRKNSAHFHRPWRAKYSKLRTPTAVDSTPAAAGFVSVMGRHKFRRIVPDAVSARGIVHLLATVQSAKTTQCGPDGSAQPVRRVARSSRTVRHLIASSPIRSLATRRSGRPGAGEEWLAATKHDGWK